MTRTGSSNGGMKRTGVRYSFATCLNPFPPGGPSDTKEALVRRFLVGSRLPWYPPPASDDRAVKVVLPRNL